MTTSELEKSTLKQSMLLQVNDINMYVEIHGAELSPDQTINTDLPVLIAVPGGPGFSHTILKPGLNPVSEHFPLVYFDPRGTGRSELCNKATWTITQQADDLAELIKKLGIKNAYLYGHSGGVDVSAAVIKHYPGLVKGLISANGIIADKQTVFDNWIKLGGDVAKRALIDLDMAAVPDFMTQVLPKYDPISRPEEHAATLEANIEQCLHMVHAYLDSLLLTQLEESDIPCVFIMGKHDPLSPPEQSIPLLEQAAKPNYRWEVFEESGHDNLLCEPTRTIETILATMNT